MERRKKWRQVPSILERGWVAEMVSPVGSRRGGLGMQSTFAMAIKEGGSVDLLSPLTWYHFYFLWVDFPFVTWEN